MPEITKYELLEELGHGGMATVYRAHDRRLRRDVAVKVLHRHLRDSVEVSHRFRAEAHAVAKLKHPNIVEVYDVSDDDDREKYLVVELLRGETLRSCMRRLGAMPPEVCACIGIELLSALAHAHAEGVIHRDIKPENIMVERRMIRDQDGDDSSPTSPELRSNNSDIPDNARDGDLRKSLWEVRVKLMDFGIAKLLDAQGVTSTGQVLGSPAHMAPEQIEGAEVDARSDLFAVGIVLYEAMVGNLPFHGQNPAQVLRRVLSGEYTKAEAVNPNVGSSWSRILDRALAPAKEDRFESAKAMRDVLRAGLVKVGFSDSRRLLEEYFKEPAAFATTFEPSLKTTLCKLGHDAQTRGDALAAADHYNRALAYAPDDAALMRTVATMHRSIARRRRIRAGVPPVVGFVVLLASAFFVTRALQKPPTSKVNADLTVDAGRTVAASSSVGAETLPPDAGLDSGAFEAGAIKPNGTNGPTSSNNGPEAGTKVGPLHTLSRGIVLSRVSPATGVQVSLDDGAPIAATSGLRLVVDENAHELHFTCMSDLCEPDARTVSGGERDVDLPIELRLKSATLIVEGDVNHSYLIDKFPEIMVRAGAPARIPVKRGDETVVVQDVDAHLQKSVRLTPGKTTNVSFTAL